jgi:hypothetical protein
MYYLSRLLSTASGRALAALALLAVPVRAVTLVEDGVARCVIMLPAGVQPLLQPAAEDLQACLRKMSGAEVPIIVGEAPTSVAAVLLGVTRDGAIAALSPEEAESTWPDGYVLASGGRDLALLAGRPEGVRNAVYGLLEDHLGCHWFTPGEIGESIPTRRTVDVVLATGRVSVKPAFELRAPWYNGNAVPYEDGKSVEVAQITKWGIRNRAGGLRGYAGQDWVSPFPKELQEKEPGLQAMLNGKRAPRGAEGQVCMSYPRATEIAVNYLISVFAAHPELEYYTFSPNDNDCYCQCPGCMALGKTPSERVLRFSNAVAEGVAAKCPGKGITILPYSSTIEPPGQGSKGAGNLYPVICSYAMEQVRPKTDALPWCQTYRERVSGWMQILPRAWSYDYIGWYPGPWPLFRKLETEQNWYRSLRFTGLMPEYIDRNMGTDIHMWLTWKLGWDREARLDDLLRAFYPAYYGQAAGTMQGIFEAFERQMLGVGGSGEYMEVPRLYPVALVEEALANVSRVRQLADPVLAARLGRDENCLRLLRLFLDAYTFGGQYRRSGNAEDKAKAATACEAYLQLADSLKGTLTVGRTASGFVKAGLDALHDPGTEFTKAGAFIYQDSLDDGGKAFQAKSRSGYFITTYGLSLTPRAIGEIHYEMRATDALTFKDARLHNMYLALPAEGHNSVEVSRDGGTTWVVAYRDVRMAGGSLDYDLTAQIAGARSFLLKLKVVNGGEECLAIDNWAISGTLE